MSSRNLLNLVLLVIVAALVAVAVWEPGKKTPPPPVKLTALSKSAVHKISISRPGAPKVVLEKKDNNWRMLKPYAMPADNFKANAITELAEAKAKAHYPIKKGEDLKPYGLDTPRVSVSFNDKDTLAFGGIETLKYLRYIRKDNTLYLIFDHFYSNISNPAPEFVDHKLLQGQPTITKLVLPKLTLTANGDKWQAQPPVKQLSNDQVNELLDNWTSAHATDVLAYKPGKTGEQAKVYIKGRDKPLVFDITREKDAVSFGRADLGLQYKFSDDIGHGLLKLPAKIKANLPNPGNAEAKDKTAAGKK